MVARVFPSVFVLCLFLLWVLIGKWWRKPLMWLAVVLHLFLVFNSQLKIAPSTQLVKLNHLELWNKYILFSSHFKRCSRCFTRLLPLRNAWGHHFLLRWLPTAVSGWYLWCLSLSLWSFCQFLCRVFLRCFVRWFYSRWSFSSRFTYG